MSELTAAEIDIAAEVVHRFLPSRQPTPRLPLFTTITINEHVIEIEKTDTLWDDFVKDRTGWIRRQIEGFPPLSQPDLHVESEERITIHHTNKVFLVHGHDDEVKDAVAGFLRDLGLDVVILHEKPNEGQTIVEKFETHSDVGFAVVLLTPDDVGAPSKEPANSKMRARQNVILELGYFIGKLGRKKVCPVYLEGVELPSDVHGVLYVPYDERGTWRSKLLKEIIAAGIEFNAEKAEQYQKNALVSKAG